MTSISVWLNALPLTKAAACVDERVCSTRSSNDDRPIIDTMSDAMNLSIRLSFGNVLRISFTISFR
jgi:hypothetical protein